MRGLSPEAQTVAACFNDVESRLTQNLLDTASGRELSAAGYGGDVRVAAELDASRAAPILTTDRFSPHLPHP